MKNIFRRVNWLAVGAYGISAAIVIGSAIIIGIHANNNAEDRVREERIDRFLEEYFSEAENSSMPEHDLELEVRFEPEDNPAPTNNPEHRFGPENNPAPTNNPEHRFGPENNPAPTNNPEHRFGPENNPAPTNNPEHRFGPENNPAPTNNPEHRSVPENNPGPASDPVSVGYGYPEDNPESRLSIMESFNL